MFPIRAVLRDDPNHHEAHSLKDTAHRRVKQNKRRRFSKMVGLSLVLALSLVAFVRFRANRDMENFIRENESLMASPERLLLLLEERYGADPPARILEFRTAVAQRKKGQDSIAYHKWMNAYKAAEEACSSGDPMAGLSLAKALPRPPNIASPTNSWPEAGQLYAMIAANLSRRSVEVDVSVDASTQQLKGEELLIDLMHELHAVLPEQPSEAVSLRYRVEQLLEEVTQRRQRRAGEREEELRRQKEKDQDILLATARAHEQAGDLQRSLLAYDRLLNSDPVLAQIPELQREITGVRTHLEAVNKAIELAEQGAHDQAAATLERVCKRPAEHLLPFRVESRPADAMVLVDGRERRAPFTTKSGVGEKIELVFRHPGCQERTVVLERPRDLTVHLHRFPERVWESTHRIEAVPVPAGDDHIVTDRFGRIRRLDNQSHTRWERELPTLGGIARTPVFLPERGGWLLVVSEDARVWLVSALDGEVEGHFKLPSLPKEGPYVTRRGACLSLANGSVALWTDRLEPEIVTGDTLTVRQDPRDPDPSTLVALSQSLDGPTVLRSPWTDWEVSVHATDYRVYDDTGYGFTAERTGGWIFVAWEAPKALLPKGRLWVSDENGLRAYLPRTDQIVGLDDGE